MSLKIEDIAEARLVLGDTVTIRLRELRDAEDAVYSLATVEKFYCMVKTALADTDGSALISINSSSNPTQFVTTNAAYGELDVVLLPADTAALTAGVKYNLDIKAIWADGTILSLLNVNDFSLVDRVTDATT